MSSDPHDELARARARHARERGLFSSGASDHPDLSVDQEAAIERAREAWALRRVGRDAADDDDADDQA